MEEVAFARVLSINAFRNLWLSQAVSQIFLNLLMFSLIIRVYEITRSNVAVSLVVATTILPNIVFGILAGVLVDRWDRKAVMFFAHFLRVVVVLAYLLSSESLAWIYVMTVLVGLITQFYLPAEGATIPELVTNPRLLLTANSIFTLTFFSSVILGNVLAGPFLLFFSARGTFLIVAFAFCVAAYFSARLPGQNQFEYLLSRLRGVRFKGLSLPGLPRRESGTIFENLMEVVDHLYRTPKVRKAIFYMAVGQGVIAVLGSIAPGFADRILRVKPSDVSLLIMAPAALGMITGALIVGQYFHGVRRETLIRFGFLAAGTVLVIFSQVDLLSRLAHLRLLPTAMAVLITLGLANAFLEVPINTLVQENTPVAVRSRVYGIISTVIGVAAILPVFLAGAVADFWGVRVVMTLSGLIILILALDGR